MSGALGRSGLTDGIAWRSRNQDSCLYHADRAELMAQLPEGSIDCIWTDPPYLLSNDGTTCVAGRRVSVNNGEWDRSRGLAEKEA